MNNTLIRPNLSFVSPEDNQEPDRAEIAEKGAPKAFGVKDMHPGWLSYKNQDPAETYSLAAPEKFLPAIAPRSRLIYLALSGIAVGILLTLAVSWSIRVSKSERSIDLASLPDEQQAELISALEGSPLEGDRAPIKNLDEPVRYYIDTGAGFVKYSDSRLPQEADFAIKQVESERQSSIGTPGDSSRAQLYLAAPRESVRRIAPSFLHPSPLGETRSEGSPEVLLESVNAHSSLYRNTVDGAQWQGGWRVKDPDFNADLGERYLDNLQSENFGSFNAPPSLHSFEVRGGSNIRPAINEFAPILD